MTRVHLASWRTTYQGMVDGAFLDSMERDLDRRIQSRRERLARPGVWSFVAMTPEQHVIGFLDGGQNREPNTDYDAELYAIYLLKGWQGLGIGRALVHILAQTLIAAECSRMLVWVLSNNPSRIFYERLGGRILRAAAISIGAQTLEETAYGFDNLALL